MLCRTFGGRQLLAAVVLTLAATSHAGGGGAYNRGAGSNAPSQAFEQKVTVDKDGKREVHEVVIDRGAPQKDHHGNAQGNQYDLAVDGAFDGQTIAVLHFYLGFDFSLPKAALKEKGFGVYRWVGQAPSPAELEEKLKQANQLWIISDAAPHLNDEHIAVIKRYFDSGRGVYIWGDNQPYYADANAVGQALLGVEMTGDIPGGHPVGIQKAANMAGVRPNHLLTTGIETVFEGATIATINTNQILTPIIWGSANNIVTSAFERDGKRAIFDGGFTRLYVGWETAGTARYVKNAAAWLANVERFGDAVTAAGPTKANQPVQQ